MFSATLRQVFLTMAPAKLPPVSPGVRSFLLDNELLLFAEQSATLFRLNASAAFIWCGYEEGLDHSSIANQFATAYSITPEQAERDIQAVVTEWQKLGLLGESGKLAPAESARSNPPVVGLRGPGPLPPVGETLIEHRYQLLDTVFRLRFAGADIARRAQSVLGHLGVAVDRPYDVSVDVAQDEQGYVLYSGGEPVAQCATAEELAPLFHGQVLLGTYSRTACLIAVHAAAIIDGSSCVVFPAGSGSGKSTLTAALIASGFQYGTDELVLLEQNSYRVRPMPVSVGLKSGAWPLLEAFHPGLQNLPVHWRQDDKEVRYLSPAKQVLPADMSRHYSLHSIVFPKLQEQGSVSLTPVGAADALCRITEAGYDTDGGLDAGKVQELIDWIVEVNCYELRFNDLHDAIAAIRDLFS